MERVKDVLDRYSLDLKKLKVLKEKREELDRVLNARKKDIRDGDQIDHKVRELDLEIKFVCDETRRRIFNAICDKEDETSLASSSSCDETSRRIFNAICDKEDETSLASSSSSALPEDEASPSTINGGEQKQTVLGQGGIGLTKIFNSRSNITNEFGYVHIENKYYQRTRRKRKE